MNYRQLGNTKIKISETGFGCMSLGKNTENESLQLIHQAIDEGINYFDTADVYDNGANEELLGKALEGRRNNIILATKVGNVVKTSGDKDFGWDPSKKHILKAVEMSLRRLKTDYIDLYQLHGGTIDDPIDETIEAFETLKEQGKIMHYGISSIRPNVIKEYARRSAIVSVMMQYSLLDRRPEEEVLELLQQHNISVMARGVLAQGLLAGKAAKEYLKLSVAQVIAGQQAVQKIEDSDNKKDGATGYVLHHKAVTAAVIGFRSRRQLEDVLHKNKHLSEDDYLHLQQAVPPLLYEQHR